MMVKVVVVIRRVEAMSRETFLQYWQEGVVPYVEALPGVRAYEQSPAIVYHREQAWDGMAQMWFDDVDSFRAALSGPEGDAIREYEEQFIGERSWFLATDRPVFGDASHGS